MGSKGMRGIAWVKNIWRGRQLDMDLDDELRAYVAQLTDEYRARGYEPEEALRAARIEAGAIESIKDQVRDARSGASIETLWQDIRFGVRLLRRSPSFMGAAVVSLALGIGANSAVFGLLNALRLRSLPVPRAQELAEIRLDGPRCCRHTGRNKQVSLPFWNEIRAEQQAFSESVRVRRYSIQSLAARRSSLCRGAVRFGKFLPGARRARRARARDRSGGRSGRMQCRHRRHQRCALAARVRRRADILSRRSPTRTGQVRDHRCRCRASFFGVEVGRRFDVAMPLCASGFNRRGPLVARRPRSAQPRMDRAIRRPHI